MTRRFGLNRRPALSLLEVLVALAIFVMGIVAVAQIITLAGDTAMDIYHTSEAVRLAQSKMDEVAIGAVPFSSQGQTELDGEPKWFVQIDAEEVQASSMSSVPSTLQSNMQYITVTLSREMPDGSMRDYCTLSQILLNPAANSNTLSTDQVGSSLDVLLYATTQDDTSSSNATGGGGGAGGGGGGAAMAGGGAAAASPAKKTTGGNAMGGGAATGAMGGGAKATGTGAMGGGATGGGGGAGGGAGGGTGGGGGGRTGGGGGGATGGGGRGS